MSRSFSKDCQSLEREWIPDEEETKKALGDKVENKRVQKVFSWRIAKRFYTRKKVKSELDWIPATKQKPQSYDEFLNSTHNQVYCDRKTIYILPLSDEISSDFLSLLEAFTCVFFTLPVEILPAVSLSDLKVKYREKSTGKQYSGKHIVKKVSDQLRVDAYGMMVITDQDIYHKKEGNFVFGFAGFTSRIGIFSLARFHPDFFEDNTTEMSEEEINELVLFRSVKIMFHEISHMFGIKHGVYYEGVMNGTMTQEESDNRPSHLGIIGLKKLWDKVKFDPLERFKLLVHAGGEWKMLKKDKAYFEAIVKYLERKYEDEDLKEPFYEPLPFSPKAERDTVIKLI